MVESTLDGTVATITIRGDLDDAATPEVAEAIAHAVSDGWRDLVLDMGAVVLMNVTGLEFIVRTRSRLAKQGGTLRVSRPTAEVHRLLAVCGIVALDLSSRPLSASRAADRQSLALAYETDSRGYGT